MSRRDETGVGPISYVAGCAMGAAIIVVSVSVLYPVAVVLRLARRVGRAFAGHPPPRIATL